MRAGSLFSITRKGRAVLAGPTVWCLSVHLRDVLALCDPQVSVEHLRQSMPRESLHAALFALRELELIEGPAVPAPDHTQWRADPRRTGAQRAAA